MRRPKRVERPTWDAVWMATAFAVAGRSLCSRAQVGAAIVTADNRVQAVSYNGPPPSFNHAGMPCTVWCPRSTAKTKTEDYTDCPASHAEMAAIARADWSQLDGGTIYVTGAVCYGCAKLILQTNLANVVHVVRPSEAHRHPADVEAFLLNNGVRVHRWNEEAGRLC